jgi:hypothetical protein
MEVFGKEYESVSNEMMSYTSAVAHGKSARKVDKRRTDLLLRVKEAERNVRRMKPFQGDSGLRDSVASYFRICYLVLNEDYAKIVNLEEIAEQSYDAMEAYLLTQERANDKVNEANKIASTEYKAFAAKNNVRLIEGRSRLSQKLDAAGRVMKYHDQVYLLFFKSYKNEAYLLEAQGRGDINAMEQSKNAIYSSATEDLGKLGKLENYEGDGSLKHATQQMLKFYQSEAQTKIPIIIDYHLKFENFNKIKAAFDAIQPNQRKQQDIDKYNQVVKEMNDSATKANKISNELNKSRGTLLSNWNKASSGFLDKYTPRHN